MSSISSFVRLSARCFCAAAVGALLLLGPVAPSEAQDTRIAAVVNDEAISVSDLENRLKLVLVSSGVPDTPETRQRLRPQVLRGLIDERLEMQEAKRLKVTVSDADIEEALGRIAKQNNLTADQLTEYLGRVGIDRQVMADQLTASLSWGRLIRRRLSQSIVVSDEEVDDTIAQLKANLNKPREHVAQIFLAVDNPQLEDEIRRTSERLFEQIRGGASFNAVARQFSQSPTAANGGDLGWVTAGELPPEVQAVLDQMRPNQVSVPIRSTGGYYIMLLMERSSPSQKTGDDVFVSLNQVVLPIPAGSTEDQRAAVTARLRDATRQTRSCGELAKVGRDLSPQLSGELGRIRVGELPAALRPVVLGLKVATPSQPLPVPAGIGVLMVCSREDPPGDMPSREEVIDSIGRQRLETLARRYLRDLRRVAYIDVRV